MWLILEKIHGHLAVLGLVACLHAPIALRHARRPRWATRISGYAGSALLALSTSVGWFIYPEYRAQIRQHLYASNPTLGRAFEIKEHLGTYALFLVLVGAALLWLSDRPGGAKLRTATQRVYLLAVAFALVSAVFGVWIASYSGFAYSSGG
jgi:hypothetical protein